MLEEPCYDNDASSNYSLSTYISVNAAKGLQEITKSNLGPKGTFKILVSGSGEIKLTKNGNTLLKEMQIQNPVASLIARSISAQNYFSGDGTTSIVLILGELFRNIEKYLEKGIHPQILREGLNIGRRQLEKWLPTYGFHMKEKKKSLIKMATAFFCTKLKKENSQAVAKIIVDAILTIRRKNEIFDINLIEIMQMDNRTEIESRFVKGIILDHGARHPDMPKILHNCFILICNVNLEYEKTEINSVFLIDSSDKREKLFAREREVVDKKINKIIQLKRFVCKNENKGFVVINQKGIDNISLDILCREGILGIRRAKRKNMERLSLLCNAIPINSLQDIGPDILGFAGLVYEQTIGEEKYTFIENVSNPFSGTILIRGNNSFLRKHTEDVIRDGLKVVKLCFDDTKYLPGGGIIEKKGNEHLFKYAEKFSGGKKFGIIALAESLLIIPRVLNENEGKNCYQTKQKNNNKFNNENKEKDKDFDGKNKIIFDCLTSKKQIFNSVCIVASQILQIDEILLGRGMH
ncbi:T-complex protein 1, zeta SU (nucleomorph) [Chroomonas mesostigmatica CCMP1168]|uniref:T-complex protein 1, zeta SU n=1 Tax=Chroomonas mesostigmatica CCMP1168 TaxID=1195612 RepID=J7G2M0_9CRYP|nr:T-complex protein 1, zeta SU [Chroomonas mesostigmatica CCMP1168]